MGLAKVVSIAGPELIARRFQAKDRTGMTTSVRIVELTMPPTIGAAIRPIFMHGAVALARRRVMPCLSAYATRSPLPLYTIREVMNTAWRLDWVGVLLVFTMISCASVSPHELQERNNHAGYSMV